MIQQHEYLKAARLKNAKIGILNSKVADRDRKIEKLQQEVRRLEEDKHLLTLENNGLKNEIKAMK